MSESIIFQHQIPSIKFLAGWWDRQLAVHSHSNEFKAAAEYADCWIHIEFLQS
jgi:hypothetical protein